MNSHGDNIVENTDDALKKILTENYAYIDDSTFLDLVAAERCDVAVIAETFYNTGFGLVFPKGWEYKKYFDAV